MPVVPLCCRRRPRWGAAFAAALLGAAVLAACSPAVPRGSGAATTSPASRPAASAPPLAAPPTANGIFRPLPTESPLTGEALLRARMTGPQILESIQKFTAGDLAAGATTTTSPATEPHEPPPQAVKYYLQGRALFLDGSNSDAMDALDKSLALDPEAFPVLRLMGRVCFAASQLARGSLYLQRAYRLQPQDMETSYLLGRYWLERKDNDRAVFYLMNADRVKSRGEAQAPLISYYLAEALQAGRYHAAAARAFEQFLVEATLPVAGYRYDRELSYLLDEQWAGHLAAAENLVLVGDYARAIPHYREAFTSRPTEAFIASRLLGAEVHAHELDAAKRDAVRFVTATGGSSESLQLLLWYARSVNREATFVPAVTAALAQVDEPARVQALAAADDLVGRPGDAFDLLRGYAAKNLGDLDTLQRLFRRVTTPRQLEAALAAAGEALQGDPARYDELFPAFAGLATSDAAAEWAIHPSAPGSNAFAADLAAITLVANDGPPEAIRSAFAAAIAGAPDFLPARASFVHWLLANDQFSQAEILVNAALAQPQPSPRAADLRVDLALAKQDLPQALTIARDACKTFPEDEPLHLHLAAIYRARGQYVESDKLLTDLIQAHPQSGAPYEALIGSLLERIRRPDAPGGGQNALRDAVSWLGRLTNAIPTSTFGQITTATLYSQTGRGEEAEAMMTRLAQQHPEDPEVIAALARARQANGKGAAAVGGLEGAIEAHPVPSLVAALAQLYRTQGKPDEAAALVQRMVKAHPHQPGYAIAADVELGAQKKSALDLGILQAAAAANPRSEALALLLARRLSTGGGAEESAAVAGLQSFIARNGATTDRLYALSHLLSQVGQDAAAEGTLQQVLTLLPTHRGANNDLGFYWADAGRNLEQAEGMVKKALEAEPDNGAYLDSLGWVYYKQGRFTEALSCLDKALQTPDGQSAEVVAHAADALFRAGRASEATERWRQAQTLLNGEDLPLTRDDERLKGYLEQVLSAVSNHTPPEVTPTASGGIPRAATR